MTTSAVLFYHKIHRGGGDNAYPDVPAVVLDSARYACYLLDRYGSLRADHREETFQVALVSAWEVYAQSEGEVEYRTLCQHTWNALRRWWRQEQSWYARTVGLEQPDEDGEWQPVEFVDPTCEAVYANALLRVEIERLYDLAGVRAQDRWLLKGLAQGLSQSEIAKQLGCSQAWVSRRLAQLRARLSAIALERGIEVIVIHAP